MARPIRHPLIIVAHPDPDSYCVALAAAVADGFGLAGVKVDLIDLYRDEFRAAMSRDERLAYHEEQPILDEQVANYAARVSASDGLVFVYPTWWSGLPAILKGFLDRVMVPGVGFTLDARSGRVKPGLGHLRRIVGISTYGSPRRYVRFVNDNGRRHLLRTLRLAAGLRCRTTWLGLYEMDTATPDQRGAFLAEVAEKMTELAGGAAAASTRDAAHGGGGA